jgi:hypothetical protein
LRLSSKESKGKNKISSASQGRVFIPRPFFFGVGFLVAVRLERTAAAAMSVSAAFLLFGTGNVLPK